MLSFFATSRVSGLASIVTAMKFSKMSAGPEPPCEISGGGGSSPSTLSYFSPMYLLKDRITRCTNIAKLRQWLDQFFIQLAYSIHCRPLDPCVIQILKIFIISPDYILRICVFNTISQLDFAN